MKIKNDEQAYINALVLSITAPTEKLSKECLNIASIIETRLTEKQIDLCKKAIEVFQEIHRKKNVSSPYKVFKP